MALARRYNRYSCVFSGKRSYEIGGVSVQKQREGISCRLELEECWKPREMEAISQEVFDRRRSLC